MRKDRGWSAQRLADEMKATGIPWERSVVANIENGRRPTVSVSELLALGVILNVSPLALLLPQRADEIFEVAAGIEESAEQVALWILGQQTSLSGVPKDSEQIDLARAAAFQTAFPAWLRRRVQEAAFDTSISDITALGRQSPQPSDEEIERAILRALPTVVGQVRGILTSEIIDGRETKKRPEKSENPDE